MSECQSSALSVFGREHPPKLSVLVHGFPKYLAHNTLIADQTRNPPPASFDATASVIKQPPGVIVSDRGTPSQD
jgi:hypothetical protein